jgi:hypothetical protein
MVLNSRFGIDFSHVRVHTDNGAAQSAQALSAAAYTVGHHVVFGPGEYRPRTRDGLRLLAHELAHVTPRSSVIPPGVTSVSDPTSEPELRAQAAGASLGREGRPPVHESGLVQRAPIESIGTLGPSGVTTTEHDELVAAASSYRPSDLEFGFTDVIAWRTDPKYLDLFKDNFVYANRAVITAAAAKYDIPAELLAGVVRIEIGGKDPIKPLVYQVRNWVPFTADRDTTSLGQQAMQPRRAAESLGYDPRALSEAQHEEILRTLESPTQSIFLAANHLSDLRNVDFPGTAGHDLIPEQIEIIGARYNQGPTRALDDVQKDLSYGRAITRRWGLLGSLLTTRPKPLEYAPIQNNIVDPLNRATYQLERNIYNLYGVPYL